ncbi:hypothetical protein PPYR_14556 [Photinus pyralis]|uniref:Uncharacterized protein n=1 Tax=Photinus pyralis TaxID=7054 RepID=A0A1Y1MI60_PHOPY|nr:histidine-rich glycoprotein-like [Photinus pyralis]KAB0792597.1 hypothetical protein PPYR_14556 [Photinus pyralis]
MKFAAILLAVVLLEVVNLSLANHAPALEQHHQAEHNSHKEDNEKKDAIAHKHVKTAGHNQHHDSEKSHKGEKVTLAHKTHDNESGGKKTEHSDGNYRQSHKKLSGGSEHGAKHKQAAKDKKTHYSKAFREQYHKDEHNKHDAFYSNGHKSGEYHVYGGKNHKFHDIHYTKNGHGKHTAGKHSERNGKTGKKSDKHKVPTKKIYQRDTTREKYAKQEKWAKKSLKANKQHPHLVQ